CTLWRAAPPTAARPALHDVAMSRRWLHNTTVVSMMIRTPRDGAARPTVIRRIPDRRDRSPHARPEDLGSARGRSRTRGRRRDVARLVVCGPAPAARAVAAGVRRPAPGGPPRAAARSHAGDRGPQRSHQGHPPAY